MTGVAHLRLRLPAFLLLFGVAAAACAAGPAEERHWRGLLLEIADTRAAPGDAERLWFETPALNAGLPEADSPPNLRTPQAALELFLQAARSGELARAAQALNLNLIPEDAQAARAAEISRQLLYLLENRISVDWERVPDRRDGRMDPSLLEGDALSGSGGDPARVRRSIALGHLDLEGRPVPVRLQRVRPAGGDPRWVFSAQTVENIPALYRLHGPGWIETVVPERWRGPLIGTRAGDWLVLGVVTAVLGLAAWLLLRLGAGLARHRAGTPLGTLIGRTRRPLAPLLALWLLREMYQALFTLNGVLPLGNLLVSRVASIGAFVLARGFLSRGGSAGCLHDL